MPPAKQTDPTEIELAGFILGSGGRFVSNGSSSLLLGESISSGMNVSGVVKRIVYTGGEALRVHLDQGPEKPERILLVFQTGMLAEVKP
jgi:hypothetical protein